MTKTKTVAPMTVTPEQATEVLSNLTVLVIGDNQCWGKAPLLADALKNAYSPKKYVAYIVHEDTTVHPVDGSLEFPIGYRPIAIAYKGLTGLARATKGTAKK